MCPGVHLAGMDTDASRSRRRLAALIALAGVVLLIVGVGVYGLIAGPRPADPPPPESSSPAAPTVPVPDPGELEPLPETDDSEEFARLVAGALFA